MAITYKKIASVNLSSAQANIDFSSIPATYDDLILHVSVRSAGSFTNRDMGLKINNGTSITWRYLRGDGTSAASSNGSATNYVGTMPAASNTASTFGSTMFYIPNYATSTNKSISVDSTGENNATSSEIGFWAVLWSGGAAINQLTIYDPSSNNLVQHSTATLYGIKKA